MKKVTFTNIYLENFGRFTEPIQSKLGHRTIISGQNGIGKSTLKRMIQYVLGTKDESGKEISGIRPHDENGVDIDGLTTVVELTVSVDGLENTLKRTCFQEKNRQDEYTGKDNLQYFVDNVKKTTKKAYDELVHTIIPNLVCISAQELLMKDTAGRRAMLEVFSKHDTDSIIAENPDFEPLRGKLKANTVADLKKACRDKIKEKSQKRDTYPALINEVEKQKVDIDIAELELLKNSLNEKINEVKAKQANVDKQYEEYDKQAKDILDLQFALSDLKRKANEELAKKKRELQTQIDEKGQKLQGVINNINDSNRSISGYEQDIESGEKERQRLLEQWNKVNSETFDENAAVCPTCNRELPKEEREALLTTFEKTKAERIANIEKYGSEVKADIDNANLMMPKLQGYIKENTANKERLEKEIADLEKQLSELPESIDISDREDVKQLKQHIADKEQAMQKANSGAEIRQQLQDELEELQRQKAEVVGKMNLSVKNDGIDERVAELKKQQLALSQEIADIEKELDLLKSFERRKAELLETDVNAHFSIIHWHMFREMQNGDLADICSPFVNGTSYDTTLNYGAKILAEIDICLSFQKLYEIETPILLDNSESIDSDKIPNVDNQIIRFIRTDSKELKIETE